MFGKNPARELVRSDGLQLAVQEMFRTIQGEGPFTGRPATFVRLWGCHLHCYFCDTDFESNKQLLKTEEMVEDVRDGPALVVLTGGEPMRQNVEPLCRALLLMGKTVQVETAGSFALQPCTQPYDSPLYYHPNFHVIVSPKTTRVDEEVAAFAKGWKYIVSAAAQTDVEDGLPVTNTQFADAKPRRLARPPLGTLPEHVWVQPMDEQDAAVTRANMFLCTRLAARHGYRISLQTHKILGVP